MKKFAMLLMLFNTSIVLANVELQISNLPNDEKVFIASFTDGKTIYAHKLGSFAIVPDSELKDYPENTIFTVGTENSRIVRYCANATDNSQFLFNYKAMTNNALSLEGVINNQNNFSIICKKLSPRITHERRMGETKSPNLLSFRWNF